MRISDPRVIVAVAATAVIVAAGLLVTMWRIFVRAVPFFGFSIDYIVILSAIVVGGSALVGGAVVVELNLGRSPRRRRRTVTPRGVRRAADEACREADTQGDPE